MGQHRFVRVLAWISKYSPYLIAGSVAVVLTATGGLRSIAHLLDQVSDHPFLAVSVLMLLFAVKSVSLGIPFAFLYLTIGGLFPLELALLINLAGILINLQAPYWFGRLRGKDRLESLAQKYPRFAQIVELGGRNGFAIAFIAKFIGKIPHEITNALLGAIGISYPAYISGAVLGLLPVMVTSTLVGRSMEDPNSFSFIAPMVVLLALTACSLLLYGRRTRNHR